MTSGVTHRNRRRGGLARSGHAQAVFDVDDYEHYVEMQSESALRHMASCYAYDHGKRTRSPCAAT